MDYLEKGSPVRQNIRQDVYNSTNFVGRVDAQSLTSKDLNAESLSVDDIQISKTVQTSRTLDVFALFDAVFEDPFDVESWKASFTISEIDGSVLNGVYETSGDFSTETSYANLIGITPSDDGTYKETVFQSAFFLPTGGEVLGGSVASNNLKIGAPEFNVEWTYTYEEDSSATGSDPKYIHDFRITFDSTQILGYVVIYADDSEFHNFIIDSAGN